MYASVLLFSRQVPHRALLWEPIGHNYSDTSFLNNKACRMEGSCSVPQSTSCLGLAFQLRVGTSRIYLGAFPVRIVLSA
jgi:hypothetical protein